MENTKFRIESNRAEMMARAAPGQADYWTGFGRGLRRAQFGSDFGSTEDHLRYLQDTSSPDPIIAARAQGYRDGLAAGR